MHYALHPQIEAHIITKRLRFQKFLGIFNTIGTIRRPGTTYCATQCVGFFFIARLVGQSLRRVLQTRVCNIKMASEPSSYAEDATDCLGKNSHFV
jgi:hypothetical protein